MLPLTTRLPPVQEKRAGEMKLMFWTERVPAVRWTPLLAPEMVMLEVTAREPPAMVTLAVELPTRARTRLMVVTEPPETAKEPLPRTPTSISLAESVPLLME